MTTTREAVALLTGAALGATAAAYLLRSRPDSDAGLGSSGDRPHAEAVAAAPACSSCSCSFAAAADSVGPFTPPGRVRTRAGKAPDPYDSAPRTDYLCWDDYFMSVAFLSAQRSKDPKKQVGACIVDENKVIVGIGYNGFPRGCPDDALSWAKLSASGNVLETKMPYVVHAEANAILNTNARSLHGAHLYVTMYPCCECAKLIIQAGIRAVTYYEAKNTSDTAGGAGKDALYAAAARMLKLSGVRVSQHRPAAPLELCLFSSSGGGERKVQSTPHAEGDGGGELL